MRRKVKQFLLVILLITCVSFLENITLLAYPLVISRYSVSNIIYEFLIENGHLPLVNLRHDDFYQPVIFLSFLLLFFLKMINSPFNHLFFYTFPIIVYLLTRELSIIFNINNHKTRTYISLTNATIATFSTYILDMSNDLVVFFIMLLLLYIHIKDGFQFTNRFYLIAFTSSIFITFYYYTGQLTYTIFFFLFYLYFLVNKTKSRKYPSLFLLLSWLNFLLFFFIYGIIGNVGFSATLQNFFYRLFLVPPIWLFYYLSILTFLFHILLEKKFALFYNKIIKIIEKSIKYWLILILILIIISFIFIIYNFDKFVRSENMLLNQFSFPPAYFNQSIRILNIINFVFISFPYFLFGISIIRKFSLKLKLSQIDLLYLISISLILIFLPLYYFYGGLNMVMIRGIRLIIIFAVLLFGFSLVIPKSFFTYLINPSIFDINKIGTKSSYTEKDSNRNNSDVYIVPDIGKNHSLRKVDNLIIIISIQGILQFLLILLFNYDSFIIYFVKFILIGLNYSYLPGYTFIKLFSLKHENLIEQFLWAIIIGFYFFTFCLFLINLFSIFNLISLIILPYILFSFNIIVYAIVKFIKKNFNFNGKI